MDEEEVSDDESVDNDAICTADARFVKRDVVRFLEEGGGVDSENGLSLCSLLWVLGVLGVTSISFFSSTSPIFSTDFFSLTFSPLVVRVDDLGDEKMWGIFFGWGFC